MIHHKAHCPAGVPDTAAVRLDLSGWRA